MKTLDTRLAWPVRIHQANTLAMEWGGGIGTSLVSEEDITFLFAIPLKEDLTVIQADGSTEVFVAGMLFRMQVNIHTQAAELPMSPDVAQRFRRML